MNKPASDLPPVTTGDRLLRYLAAAQENLEHAQLLYQQQFPSRRPAHYPPSLLIDEAIRAVTRCLQATEDRLNRLDRQAAKNEPARQQGATGTIER